MKINVKATNLDLTPAISDYIDKKISSVKKFLPTEVAPDGYVYGVVTDVEVGKTAHHKTGDIFKAEVHIMGNSLDIYAVSEQADLYMAIDMVRDEIVHNATQLKTKRLTLTRRGAQMIKSALKGLSSFKKRP